MSTKNPDFKTLVIHIREILILSKSLGQACVQKKVIKILSREFSTSYPHNVDNFM